MDGIFNILKPPGMTSHDVIYRVRRLTGIKKCGHTGTLDPGAAGVLPVCIGRATRVSEYALGMDKSYRAELTLGVATDTEDAGGRTVLEKDVPELSEAALREVFAAFLGEIKQVPPMYSALRKNGVRLYELARKGETVERDERTVHVYRIEPVCFTDRKIVFDVACSRGTYVRTLCADIAMRLGTCGHMSFLLRVALGPFQIADAVTLEEMAALIDAGLLQTVCHPPDSALMQFPEIEVKCADALKIVNGVGIMSPEQAGGTMFRIYGPGRQFLALAAKRNEMLIPHKVFITEISVGDIECR